MPEQREDGGVIECYRRGKPAELPGVLDEREISAGKGDEASDSLHRKKKGKQKNFTKNEKNKRGEGRRLLFVGSGLLSQHRQETRGK